MTRFTPTPASVPIPGQNPRGLFPPPPPAPGAATAQAAAAGGANPMTLDALMLRQKEIAGQQQGAGGLNNGTIWGGLGSMAQSFLGGVRGRANENEINQAQQDIATNFPNAFNMDTGEINQQALQAIGARDPETMAEVYKMAMQARQHAEEMEIQRLKATGEGGPKLSDIGSLRDDYVKAANVYDQSAPAWQDMLRSAPLALDPNNPSAGAATYSLIVGYAKLLDPTSVVREGEVSAASNLGGLLDTINGWLLKAKNGTMDPNTLRAIMQQGQSRMKGYYDQVKTKRDWLTGVATRNRMNPEDVVAPLGELPLFEEQQQQVPTIDVATGATPEGGWKQGTRYRVTDPDGSVHEGTYLGGDINNPKSWKDTTVTKGGGQ